MKRSNILNLKRTFACKNNPKTIWENLRFIFQKTCKKESCWLKHKCLNENISLDIKSNTFAPNAPEEWKAKPDEWLSSIEIMEVMKQYEKSYKCFELMKMATHVVYM